MTNAAVKRMMKTYAAEGAKAAAAQSGVTVAYVYQLAHINNVVSPTTRLRQERKRAQMERRNKAEPAAPAKRAVMVCPGCVWAGGVPGRRICPRLACGKVRWEMRPHHTSTEVERGA